MSCFLKNLFKNERGAVSVLMAAGLLALFGITALVTDFGRLAVARQNLVNAVDAAAMAGAGDLVLISDPIIREDTARQTALNIAAANGAPPAGTTVRIEDNIISVDAEQNVNLIMSKIFGITAKTVSAHAAATVGSVNSYTGIAPLSIKEQPLTFGTLCTLKYGSPDSPGNFGALALSGRGSFNYKQNLIDGFQSSVSVGDVLETEPGNMSGPTDGIDQRLDRCTDGCTYDNFRPGCPKILIVPTHRNEDLQGRDQIVVTGFVAFFVDREATNCDSDEIKGYFVRMAAGDDIDQSQPAGSLYGVKLIE